MDEKELLILAKKGDLKAFEKLISIYSRHCFSFGYYHLKNRSDAEDFVQEVFYKLFLYIKSYNENKKFFSWFYEIEKNVLKDFFKKRNKRKEEIDEKFFENVVFYDNHIGIEDKISLFKAIESLNEDEKDLIFMKYNEDLSIKEIAEILKLSEENVKVRLFRAKQKLLSLLGKEV
ncbi:MAG: RNA polymerase sigma factor [Brevinematia bacterium]